MTDRERLQAVIDAAAQLGGPHTSITLYDQAELLAVAAEMGGYRTKPTIHRRGDRPDAEVIASVNLTVGVVHLTVHCSRPATEEELQIPAERWHPCGSEERALVADLAVSE